MGVVLNSSSGWEERKEMCRLMMHSTHFLYSYNGVGHMVEDYSDSEKRNLVLPLNGLLF